jgi:hypothetical protein
MLTSASEHPKNSNNNNSTQNLMSTSRNLQLLPHLSKKMRIREDNTENMKLESMNDQSAIH